MNNKSDVTTGMRHDMYVIKVIKVNVNYQNNSNNRPSKIK